MKKNLIKNDHFSSCLGSPTCVCYSSRKINLVLFSTFHTQIASRFNAACRAFSFACTLRLQTFLLYFISSLAFIFIFQLICTERRKKAYAHFVEINKIQLTHHHLHLRCIVESERRQRREEKKITVAHHLNLNCQRQWHFCAFNCVQSY